MSEDRPWDRKKSAKASSSRDGETVGEWWGRAPFWQKFIPVAAALLLVGWCSVETKKNMDDASATGDTAGARRFCRDSVKSQLKSPGSADFSQESATSNSSAEWTVTGVVDSDNSFGASVRNGYRCSLKYLGDDRWSLTDIKTDGN